MRTGKWAEFNGQADKGRDVIWLCTVKFCHGDREGASRKA